MASFQGLKVTNLDSWTLLLFHWSFLAKLSSRSLDAFSGKKSIPNRGLIECENWYTIRRSSLLSACRFTLLRSLSFDCGRSMLAIFLIHVSKKRISYVRLEDTAQVAHVEDVVETSKKKCFKAWWLSSNNSSTITIADWASQRKGVGSNLLFTRSHTSNARFEKLNTYNGGKP